MEFKFKKKYGQNFLIQKNIIKKIISISENKSPSLVIEIGCGDGRMTEELCNQYDNVLGYEIDNELKPFLDKTLKNHSNYTIIYDDFLNRNLEEDIKKYEYNNLYIIANLPYYITTSIIEKIIESDLDIFKMVFMIQREVGEKFCAKPNTKEYNSLAVFLNYYFDIKKEITVNKENFFPKPNVDSIVISFTKKDNILFLKNKYLFFKLVRDSFKYKRKTLKNNLQQKYDWNIITKVLKKYNLNLSIRAEQLDLIIFTEIANNL